MRGWVAFLVVAIASSGRLLCNDVVSELGLRAYHLTALVFRSTLKLINTTLFGPVQTKPVQSKTASLGIGPVRPSGWTGPD